MNIDSWCIGLFEFPTHFGSRLRTHYNHVFHWSRPNGPVSWSTHRNCNVIRACIFVDMRRGFLLRKSTITKVPEHGCPFVHAVQGERNLCSRTRFLNRNIKSCFFSCRHLKIGLSRRGISRLSTLLAFTLQGSSCWYAIAFCKRPFFVSFVHLGIRGGKLFLHLNRRPRMHRHLWQI